MWKKISACLAAAAVVLGAHPALAESVALIGTGNVGAALGQRFAANGHEVFYGSRTPNAADVRELVAASAAEDVVRSLGDLAGKILVDPTNPRVMASDGFADYPIEDSNAERIARLAPDAQVVKAFSTLGAETMLDPAVAGGPVTVPIVGDDRAAKERVAALAREIGLEAVDVGPLRHARIIEGLHYLRANALGGRINYHLPRDRARD